MEKFEKQVREFVKPFYRGKDEMHGLDHIDRILMKMREVSENYKVNEKELALGCYFHGIVSSKEDKIREYLEKNEPEVDANKIIQISKESLKESNPETIEGKILHDSHLLEGGKTFHFVKSLITGKARGQSLQETINYLKENILGNYQVYLEENREEYRKKEEFAREAIWSIKQNTDIE